MASIVEKYEQILSADPRSRIFVELAKALLERGEPRRAIDVCQQGLEHHPSSILGRVIWGRALLDTGDLKGAMDQFEIGIAVDPGNPYAYNLIGEALLAKERFREALPVLLRAAELQPADERARRWVEDAKDGIRAAGGTLPSLPGLQREDATELYPAASTPAPPPSPAPRPAAEAAPAAARAPGAPAAGVAEETLSLEPAKAPAVQRSDPARGESPRPAVPAPAAAVPPGPPRPPPPPVPRTAPANGVPRAPVRRFDTLPPGVTAKDEIPRSLLAMIPGATRRDLPASKTPMPAHHRPAPAEAAAEAERLAAEYEREVRARLLSTGEPTPHVLHRKRNVVLGAAAVIALGAALAIYLVVDGKRTAELTASAATRARAGIARDTRGSLEEASHLLDVARRRRPDDPELRSLSAQTAALLASEHGDGDARALALSIAREPGAGSGALVARYLLAEAPGERGRAESAILAAPPSSDPLVQALAGRILLRRNQGDAARARLGIAARVGEAAPREAGAGWPPLLRAISDLGDAARADGDPERALGLYAAALAAQPTHPRSVVGAAEVRLALGRELDAAREQLLAVEADRQSPPPIDLRPRFEIALARVLAATGDASTAGDRLARAVQSLGDSLPLATAQAEILLEARAWDRAEAAAARAVALAPGDAAARVLLARARIGRGRYHEALSATNGTEGRAVSLQRAIARYRLGQLERARTELERTARDGRLPADAAVWYALTDLAQGRPDRARTVLEKLTAGRTPPPLALVALGRVNEAQGRPADAERTYRAALERDPESPEASLALGTLLLGRGEAEAAVPPLRKAVSLDGASLDGRRALGAALLATHEPSRARAELDVVLLHRPNDREGLRLLSAAWLAEHQPNEARRAAELALRSSPRDPALLVAAARAALAGGDRTSARGFAERALRSGARGADAAEAGRMVAELRASR